MINIREPKISDKISIIALFLVGIFIGFALSGYVDSIKEKNNTTPQSSNETSVQPASDSIFIKKQECAKYKDSIKREFEEDREYSLSRKILDEIFYSPSLDTCVYSYTATSVNADMIPMPEMGKYYIITDALTGEDLYSGNTNTSENLYSHFEEEKKILKK